MTPERYAKLVEHHKGGAYAVATLADVDGLRAELAEALRAWEPLADQRNALSHAIDEVCGVEVEPQRSTGGVVPSNALEVLRGAIAAAEARGRSQLRLPVIQTCGACGYCLGCDSALPGFAECRHREAKALVNLCEAPPDWCPLRG